MNECWQESCRISDSFCFLCKAERGHLLPIKGRQTDQMSAEGGDALKSTLHKAGTREGQENSWAVLRAQLRLVSVNLNCSQTSLFSDFFLQCSVALVHSTKKTNPSGVNQEWGRKLLIYKKHNGSKGLAI